MSLNECLEKWDEVLALNNVINNYLFYNFSLNIKNVLSKIRSVSNLIISGLFENNKHHY